MPFCQTSRSDDALSNSAAYRRHRATDTALANLAIYVEQARGAHAPNTERAIRSDTAIFTTWCSDRDLTSLPAQPGTIAAFVDAMAAAKSAATVRRYVSSIAHLHRGANVNPNPASDNAVRMALKRMHRVVGREQAQAAPLTRKMVDRMLDLPVSTNGALRDRALLAVAYDTLCRRSELVSLDRADLSAGPHGDGTVTIRRSKSDQEGRGMVRYIAPDTMRELQTWLAAAGVTAGPLFRSVSKSGVIGGALDPGDVARVFKRMAKAAGIPAEVAARISGHSSRVGAAQDMVNLGSIELPAIMQAGGWKSSEMVARYSRKADARRGGSAKLAMLQNRG